MDNTSARERAHVNVGIKLLEFHQLSWRERFPPLTSQANFWELLKEEHLLINRLIAKKSTA